MSDQYRVQHPEFIWSHIDKTAPCWTFDGFHDRDGYAWARGYGNSPRLFRALWEWKNGPVPDGLVLDHFACNNRRCVNPDHVRPTTIRENNLRGQGAAATNLAKRFCAQGHPLSGDNLSIKPDGERRCLRCHAEQEQDRRRRREVAIIGGKPSKGTPKDGRLKGNKGTTKGGK